MNGSNEWNLIFKLFLCMLIFKSSSCLSQLELNLHLSSPVDPNSVCILESHREHLENIAARGFALMNLSWGLDTSFLIMLPRWF